MSAKAGMDPNKFQVLRDNIERDIKSGLYFGGSIAIGRDGELAFHESFGTANKNSGAKVTNDSVFSLFSVTKAFTTVQTLQAIEQGRFSLTTKVCEILPEFTGGARDKVTFFHLLTHTSGMPSMYTPKVGMNIDILDEVMAEIFKSVQVTETPGGPVAYAPMFNHALMGEACRRTDPKKRRWRDMMYEDILNPLKMKDTGVGLRKDLKDRHLFPDFRGAVPVTHPGSSNLGENGAFLEENAEMPFVGIVSTTGDMFRFVEMLRRGGELDGARILSPRMVKAARTNYTGDKPNEFYKKWHIMNGWDIMPACIGLGFPMRGEKMGPHLYGTLASPGTFGLHGAGTTLIWVDPETQVSAVWLMTGVMITGDNVLRFQRLSDIVHTAIL